MSKWCNYQAVPRFSYYPRAKAALFWLMRCCVYSRAALVILLLFVVFNRLNTVSRDAGDAEENWKKVIGLYQKNNNCTRASRFFAMWNLPISRPTFIRSRPAQRKNCLFLFLTLDTVLSDLTAENFATFDKLNEIE